MAKLRTELIQGQLLQVLAKLPPPRQEDLLKFALSLHQQELTQRWDAISNQEAAALKAEFADEDIALVEAALTNYISILQQEAQA